MIDSHVHLRWPSDIENLNKLREAIGAQRICVVSVIGKNDINDNPGLYAAKSAHPETTYIFTALDHSAHFSGGKICAPSMEKQIDELLAVGADGLKLIEAKPTHRKLVDIPIDGDRYAAMFERVQDAGLPVTWHVADPEEFWYPELTPSWASGRGWGYDSAWPAKESFYDEVDSVLRRYPDLKVIFAHFYFLSADLGRAGALLDEFGGVHLDLAPGIEMMYNMSKDPATAREFFIKYSDRIVFGADIEAGSSEKEAKIRASVVTRWLETDDDYRVDPEADYTLGPPEDGIIRGMKLPNESLDNIYTNNFERLAGAKPKTLNVEYALELSLRQLDAIRALGGEPEPAVEAIDMLKAGI